jgi:hypothetical protein
VLGALEDDLHLPTPSPIALGGTNVSRSYTEISSREEKYYKWWIQLPASEEKPVFQARAF